MNTPGVTADLSHISSIATIDGYLPDGGEGIKKAFKGADIVVIPAGIPRESTTHTQVPQLGRTGKVGMWDRS